MYTPPGGRMPCTGRAKCGRLTISDHGTIAGADDLALVVDVVDERVERADPLRQPALDRRPLRRGDDPRDEVERERRGRARAVGGRQLERDPLLHEDRVAQLAGRDEPLRAEALELGDQRVGVRRAGTVRAEHLVVGRLRWPPRGRPSSRSSRVGCSRSSAHSR